ncbi:hypothetical protein JX265_008129 [Neoarthrinium moseri]|uniref:FAR-17a/AIG1-like protein n=1 Tax=Neoarthrinium moseri TaxID=1658444 RepID=A0A9Q0AK89_9PEZI|nr:uncharacterized protein JN550_004826 [Neoarthrinium moseri]KAI1852066.1 hypothetical protein JX266_002919 [Neoarthrinium moseri]KAI1865082.1 hypothetical protein JX265_008129 [Neoarthrinium moseri]KAI1870680.1 hypothetical protein JN550_004826 [Neoarthrinium moseri]
MMPKAFRFGDDQWDPTHRFETSWLLPPYLLFACRAFISLYAFVTLFFTIGYQCAHPSEGSAYACQASAASFSYFTVLTYWGIAFYFLFASIHTFSYARWGVALLDRWPRPLQALHAFYYTTITTYPFLVTIVYWGILYTYGAAWFPTQYAAWSNLSQHGFNSLFALFEIVLTRTNPSPWIHILWAIVVLALYLALAYVTRATKGFYVYSFLDPTVTRHGLVAAYVFGIAIAICIIFAIVHGAVWARRWLTERKLGMEGKMAAGAHSTTSSWRDEQELEMGNHAYASHK